MMNLKIIEADFAVCKIEHMKSISLEDEFLFIGKTDEELSIVCSTDSVPEGVLECEMPWRAFRIQGPLDFSLVGILARIAGHLAEHGISLFAVSTYDTDYILVKSEVFDKAVRVLTGCSYTFA